MRGARGASRCVCREANRQIGAPALCRKIAGAEKSPDVQTHHQGFLAIKLIVSISVYLPVSLTSVNLSNSML